MDVGGHAASETPHEQIPTPDGNAYATRIDDGAGRKSQFSVRTSQPMAMRRQSCPPFFWRTSDHVLKPQKRLARNVPAGTIKIANARASASETNPVATNPARMILLTANPVKAMAP